MTEHSLCLDAKLSTSSLQLTEIQLSECGLDRESLATQGDKDLPPAQSKLARGLPL